MAQTLVKGWVRDAKTKAPLAFANVFVPGSGVGINTDENGYFEMPLKQRSDSLRFGLMGYEEKTLKIQWGKAQSLEVWLKAEAEQIQMVVVKPPKKRRRRGRIPRDSAAYDLWRQVVAHKDEHSKPKADFVFYRDYRKAQFNLINARPLQKSRPLKRHLGFVLNYFQGEAEEPESVFLPILFKEHITDVYHRQEPKAKKEIIRAERFSGVEDESVSDFLDSQIEDLNPYEGTLLFAGKSFAGPFSPASTVTYRFTIGDSILREGVMCYRLDFNPHSAQDLAFFGHAWIHGQSYAIMSVIFELPGYANLNFVKQYKVEQQYKAHLDSAGREHWLMAHEEVYAEVTAMKRTRKPPISLSMRKETRRDSVRFGEVIPDSIFKGKGPGYDPLSLKREEPYWEENRPEALTGIESGIYQMVDSVKASFPFKALYALGYTLGSGFVPAGKIEFGRVLEMVSWNEVEGTRFKLATRTSRKFSKRLNLNAYMAYGTRDQGIKGGAGFSWFIPHPDRKWRQIWGNWRYDYTMMGQINRAMAYDNIITSLTRVRPLERLMKLQNREIHYGHEWVKGLSNTLTFQQRIFYALPDNGFEFSNGQTSTDKFSVTEAKLNLHWGPGEFFFRNANNRTSLGGKLPVFDLDYTFQAMDNILGQNYRNHQFDFRVRQRLNWYLGYTRYTLRAAYIHGPAPYPVMTVHLGNQNYMNNRFAFNLMNDFEFVSDRYVSVLMDHHFDGFIFNKVPGLKKLKLRELVIFRGLYGRLDPANAALMSIPEGIGEAGLYIETGFGIENIFKVLRVDFLWRLTHRDRATTQPFGLRFSVSPKF